MPIGGQGELLKLPITPPPHEKLELYDFAEGTYKILSESRGGGHKNEEGGHKTTGAKKQGAV